MTASKNTVDLRSRRPGAPVRNTTSLHFPDKKPRTPLRVRRRRTRAILALALLICFGGCAWGVSYVSYLPRFNISSITALGTTNVPPDLVEAYAHTQLGGDSHPFISRNNIFLFNADALGRDMVAYFPRIKSAHVTRASILATAITVSITERQPFALWCGQASDCYQMDDSGFVFAPLEASSRMGTTTNSGPLTGFAPSQATSSPQQYVFQGGIATSSRPIGQSFVPAHLPGILVLLRSLSQAGFPPQGATVDNETDFSVPLAENSFSIKASFGEDVDALVKNLQLVLSSDALQGKQDQIEYVDLRFGDRVYYKLKGASETKVPQ